MTSTIVIVRANHAVWQARKVDGELSTEAVDNSVCIFTE